MATANRLPYLDNIKGLLIIWVIVGHTIQYCSSTYETDFVFRFIYSFHMPLFFFVSGYLSNRGRWDSNVIAKRAVQLLIPFVIWAFLVPLLRTGDFIWRVVSRYWLIRTKDCGFCIIFLCILSFLIFQSIYKNVFVLNSGYWLAVFISY